MDRQYLTGDPVGIRIEGNVAQDGDTAMDEHRFDNLTKLLGAGSGSRRRVLTALIPTVLATGVSGRAKALTRRARRRCRVKGGVPLEQGNCHCARTCDNVNNADFPCHDNSDCFCGKTASGKGLCVAKTGGSGTLCSSTTRCPTGQHCIALPGCQFSVFTCKTDEDCPYFGYGCVQGRCQSVSCLLPCPT